MKSNVSVVKYMCLWVLFPLVAGISIYALARPQHTILSLFFSHGSIQLPAWVKYNLPDGLWLFAVLNTYVVIWGRQFVRPNIAWITGTTLFAVLTEYLQKYHIISGTFDMLDIAGYLVAFSLTILLYLFNHNKTIKQTL